MSTPQTDATDAPARRRPQLVWGLFAIAAITVVLDQITKAVAIVLLEGKPSVPVIGDLAGFTFYRNPGAAFGMGATTTWVFTLIGIAVLIAILAISRKLASRTWMWGLGLLLGGLLGNLVDRLFRQPGFMHGAVVDFIDLHFFICNIADIAISGAAVIMIVMSFRGIGVDGRSETPTKSTETPTKSTPGEPA